MKRTNLFFILWLTITMLSCNSEDPIVNLDCSVSKTDVTTYDGNDGTITVTVNTGNGDYQFSLNSTITSPDGKFTGLTAGDYNVVVTDKENKTWTQTVTINQPDADDLVCTVTSTNVTTFGGNDGTITVTVVSGYEPYTFTLNESITSEDGLFTELVAGDYNLKVVDDLDREFTQTITITQPNPYDLICNVDPTDVTTFGGNDGTITVTVVSGYSPFKYFLNDESVDSESDSHTFTNLVEGYYDIKVIDSLNREWTQNDVHVDEPTPTPPIVTTLDAEFINSTTFILKGEVNTNDKPTTVYFEYGTTTEYGNSTNSITIPSGIEIVNITIDNLNSNTNYNFRIVATNNDGTVYGENKTFLTRYIIGDEIDGGKVFFINSYVYMGVPTSDYWIIKNQDEPGLYNIDYLYTLPTPNQGWTLLEMTSNYKDEMISNINSLNGVNGFISPIENEKYWFGYGGLQTITFPNGNIEPHVEGESYKLRLFKIIRIEY